LTENANIFQRLVIHPSTNFPGRTQEHILGGLLRKKLEPDVERWVDEARQTARDAGLDPSKLAAGVRERGEHDYDDEDTYGMDQDDGVPSDPFNEQWADMLDAFQQTLQQYVTVQAKKKYTVEEQAMGVEKVRTGLKQTLEESDDEEEEDDEEEDENGDEAAAAPGGDSFQSAGTGVSSATAQGLALEPEHVLLLEARGDMNLPKDFPFLSKRKPTGPTRQVAPPR
jgi:mediator of RNA polymerase II transcription subunit 8